VIVERANYFERGWLNEAILNHDLDAVAVNLFKGLWDFFSGGFWLVPLVEVVIVVIHVDEFDV
jgi:hypothetical protein